ncbi:MAG: DUF4384 domain-containing protein [Acidobacteriaceae bacterium]|nr:DUF4384 domain-containing protein [Acidobacteriaceae bacterium]
MSSLRCVPALALAGIGLLVAAWPSYSQSEPAQSEPDGLAARTLYYDPGDTPKPAKHVVSKRPAQSVQTVQTTQTAPVVAAPPASLLKPVSDNAMTAVPHLGVRYNLVLISDNGAEQPADPDSTFHQGDCLAVRVESNHDGYLYVIEQGSSGKWEVLLPSPQMTDESNLIRAHTMAKVPENYCFAVTGAPGTEHLFLVLSRNAENVSELNAAIKAKNGGDTPPDSQPANPTNTGSMFHPIGQQIAMLRLQSRDLTIKKVAKPVAAGEPVNAVYVVNTSSTPSDRIVTEIRLKHE